MEQQQKELLRVMLAEISADLDQTSESNVQWSSDGSTFLNSWLSKTISKLTQAFTPQKLRLKTDYSLSLSDSISSLRLALAHLKQWNRAAEAQLESNLKASVD